MSDENTTSPAPIAGTNTGLSPTIHQQKSDNRVATVPVLVEPASQEFKFYYQWSLEERKRTIPVTADSLRHLTSLSAALLAGSLTFLTGRIDPWFQGLTAVIFLTSLCCGLVGVLPYRALWEVNEPMAFHRAYKKAASQKLRLLHIAAWLIAAAFVAAMIGLVVRLASSPP